MRSPRSRDDKTREAADGFDGSWVAHPGHGRVCREAFDCGLGDRRTRSADSERGGVGHGRPAARRRVDAGARSPRSALRSNISVGIQYLESWLRGFGAVGINNLMEDAATAEISRSQIWQWLNNGVVLAEGHAVTPELVGRLIEEEVAAIRERVGADAFESGRWTDARTVFTEVALVDDFADFLTIPAYALLP